MFQNYESISIEVEGCLSSNVFNQLISSFHHRNVGVGQTIKLWDVLAENLVWPFAIELVLPLKVHKLRPFVLRLHQDGFMTR